ncbi:uncharacterized protein LOC143300208 [Babylonia areolata]|uniref:uncharacterized protein LOC143300208 n=1 Tax=Babylonia areolata TaxID=304850 RepID=UPI003FD02354
MGNLFGRYQKPPRRHTLTSSQRRPLTVDREAETDYQDELSRDRTAVRRPHLITFFYPPDTPVDISSKLPACRMYKQMNETILIGRGVYADVMLNEEHIPRHFAEVWCASNVKKAPKWYLKNISEKKAVSVTLNGVRTCLKFGEKTQLQDGCELNFAVVTFITKILVGDLGNKQAFEVEVCQMEQDSSNCSSATNSWKRKESNLSNTSGASNPLRGREGSGSARAGDPGPVVQHLVHYCPNAFPPASPGSTCCLHHHPYGCHQQPCYACHPTGGVCPPVRKQSDQETVMPTVHSPSASVQAVAAGYLPRGDPGPAPSAGPAKTQGQFEGGQKEQSLRGLPNVHREVFPAQHPGNLMTQQMYQAADSITRPGFALPELYGILPNTTFMYGPSAFHQQPQPIPQTHVLPYQHEPCVSYSSHQPMVPGQPGFMNLLRRSQSMFARQRSRPEERQRRSSCDGAQLMVAQPESAQVQHEQYRFSEPDISTLALHETANKVYYMPCHDAVSESTQIDSLKLGSSALAAISPNTTAVSMCTTVNRSRACTDSWDAMDGAAMPTSSACADFTQNHHCPVKSLAGVLPSYTDFSSGSSSGDEKPLTSLVQRAPCSIRQPQENDERQAEEKYVCQ